MLSIANANAAPPKVDQAYEVFVQTLVQSKTEFAFKDGTAFQAFLAEHLKDHKEASASSRRCGTRSCSRRLSTSW